MRLKDTWFEGCYCTTLPPQLLVASKAARRSAILTARCATAWRLSTGVILVLPRGWRTKGLPIPAKCSGSHRNQQLRSAASPGSHHPSAHAGEVNPP